MSKKLRYACLFSGIGAPLQGAYRVYGKENIEHVFSCEYDKFARQSFNANYDIAPEHFHKDVHDLDATQYRDSMRKGVLVFGFPCQSFSIAGKRLGLKDPKNGNLFFEGARVMKECMPEYAIIENVVGLASDDKGETIRIILRTLTSIGYSCNMNIVNTKDVGGQTPQSRNRIFIVCKRIDSYGNYEPTNCRFVNRRDQSRNTPKHKKGVSKVRGVSPHGKNWRATITINNKSVHIGNAKTIKEAAELRNKFIDDNKLSHIKSEVLP